MKEEQILKHKTGEWEWVHAYIVNNVKGSRTINSICLGQPDDLSNIMHPLSHMHILEVLALIWNIQILPKGIYNLEFHSLNTQLLPQGFCILCSLPHQIQVWLFVAQQCMVKTEITDVQHT